MASLPADRTPPRFLAVLLSSVPHRALDSTAGITIQAITADSRTAGPGTLFVALAGLRINGHLFAEQAAVAGCNALLVERGQGQEIRRRARQAGTTAAVIEVDDTAAALGQLAAAFYHHPAERLVLIGITGTNGKTTCSYLVESMVTAAGGRPGVIGTVNYRFLDRAGSLVVLDASHTTPDVLTLQALFRRMADAGVSHVVMEVSSHALAQGRLAGIEFDVAVFTNLSRDHLDFHGDMEQYYESKKKLFTDHLKSGGAAVIVGGDGAGQHTSGWGDRLAGELSRIGVEKIFTCGLPRRYAIHSPHFSFGLQGVEAEIVTPAGSFTLHSSLVGSFNLKNILAASGIGCALGLATGTLGAGLASLAGVPGRLEPVAAGNGRGLAVFVDYAHTPDALENVLATLRDLGPRRLVCIFGCGGDRDPGKRPLMGEIAGRLSDVVILTSDNPRSEDPEAILAAIETGVRHSGLKRMRAEVLLRRPGWKGYDCILSRRQAIGMAIRYGQPGDALLIAGKGHETYQITRSGTRHFDDRAEAAQQLAVWNR